MSRAFKQQFAIALLALSVAGCANYKGLNTSVTGIDANSLQTQKSLNHVKISTVAWPKADWWKNLGDPQLNELIAEALKDSPDLQLAEARAHQASAAAYAADASRMPEIDTQAGVDRERLARVQDPLGEGGRYSTLRTAAIDFNYTFDLWGGQRAAWEAALGQARAAEVDQKAAQLTVATDVARAYNNLGQAYVLHDLAVEDLKRTMHMVKLGKRRLDAGIDSVYQYQQSESLAASSKEQLVASEKNLQSAKIALAVLLGKGPDRGQQIVRPVILQASAVALPSQLPAELLGRRPDIVASRWRVEAASKNIDASKTRFYPNLNLSASGGVQSLLGDAMFGNASRFFSVGPTLSLPLFDGGRLRADLDARDADYDLAVAQYNKNLVQALGQVSDTINQLHLIDQQINSQSLAAQIAQNSYDTVVDRYASGIGNYLDVLSIEQQLLGAQRQLANLTGEQINLSILLMEALGGGYQPDTTALETTETNAHANTQLTE